MPSVIPRLTNVISVAAGLGQLSFLQWVFSYGDTACWGTRDINQAAKLCGYDTLRWLDQVFQAHRFVAISTGSARQLVLGYAAMRGDIETLQFGLGVRGYRITQLAL